MVHFIPSWPFRNNVLPEYKGKWTYGWTTSSVWQHVGGKVHSDCRPNIRCVRLHLLLCSGFAQARSGVWWGGRTDALVLQVLGNRRPETFIQYFWHFQWFGHCPFFSAVSHSRKEAGALGDSFPECLQEIGCVGLTVVWGDAQERLGDFSLYFITAVDLSIQEVIQKKLLWWWKFEQHKSALAFKSGRALVFYCLCKGNNWCEISKEK